MNKLFHRESEDKIVDHAAMKQVELSDEQLEQVSGGYIVNNSQGWSDFLRREQYQKTHPGTMIPLTSTH